jgi:hypothetical protein
VENAKFGMAVGMRTWTSIFFFVFLFFCDHDFFFFLIFGDLFGIFLRRKVMVACIIMKISLQTRRFDGKLWFFMGNSEWRWGCEHGHLFFFFVIHYY